MGTLAGVKYEKVYYEKTHYVATGLALMHPSEIVIASSYKGERVIGVGKHAFMSKKRFFNSLVIESGVTTIYESAFFDCASLKSISLPKSIITIDKTAFWRCTSLKRLVLPYGVQTIGASAFEYNHLEEVFIPKSVSVIGEKAFSPSYGYHPTIYCEAESKPVGWDSKWCGNSRVLWGAKSIRDENAVESTAGKSTTQGAKKVADNLKNETVSSPKPQEKTIEEKIKGGLPDSPGLEFTLGKNGSSYVVTGIGKCRDKIVCIPRMYEGKPVTSIANRAFKGNTAIRGVIIPDSVTFLGEKAFYECANLEAAALPESIKFIGHGAFGECKAIRSFDIPPTVNKIGVWAFKGCENLENVFISANVGYVGAGAFEGCGKLSIDCDNFSVPPAWDESWNPDNRPINWMAKRGKSLL